MKNKESLFEELDDIYLKTAYNGAYAAADGRSTLWSKSMGFADFEQEIPFSLNMRTCIGSLTKQFVGFAFAKLHEEGRVDFEATIDRYFPDYQEAKAVKIKHLLHMTSGIPDYTDILAEEFSKEYPNFSGDEADFRINQKLGGNFKTEEVIHLLNKKGLIGAPGSSFSYSNTNYLLLGKIISQISGQTYAEYLSDQLFKPLGMANAFCSTLFAEARSYCLANGKRRTYEAVEHQAADGSIVTTAEDMVKWLHAILQEKILSKESWNLIFNLDLGIYGLGWLKLGDWYYHGGQILGYIAEIFVRRKEKLGIIMLQNFNSTPELEQLSMDLRSKWREKFIETY